MIVYPKRIILIAIIATNPLTNSTNASTENRWCQDPCPCKKNAHNVDFTCKTSGGMVLTVGQDSHLEWFVSCKFQPVGLDALDEIRPLNLTLASVGWLHIKDCRSASYTQLLSHGLGVTSLDELRLEAKKMPLHLDQGSFANMSLTYPGFIGLELKLAGVTALTDKSLDDLSSLQHLSLQQTSIKMLPNNLLAKLTNLRNLTIYWNKNLKAIPDQLLEQNAKLERFQMANNPITNLPTTLLTNLTQLEFLDLGSGSFKTIPPTLLQSSCRSLKMFTMLHDACEDIFTRRKRLLFMFYNARRRHQRGVNPSIGQGCTRHMPAELLSTCNNLKTFKYSRKNPFTRVQFEDGFMEGPRGLTSLAIHAGLTEDDATSMLKGLSDLVEIDLSGNSLKNIDEGVIPPKVTDLRLMSNPFGCSCDVSLHLVRLSDRVRRFWDFSRIRLNNCTSPTAGDEVVQMEVQEAANQFCTTQFLTETFYGLIGLGGLAFVLASALIFICASERVRVYLYNNPVTAPCFRPEKAVTEDAAGTIYDAFVSFAEEDSEYAAYLVDVLEGGEGRNKLGGRTYTCCTHQRDWKAGESIQSNIIQSVDSSHRTLIVMSQNFLNSMWCQREFDEAYRKNKLIVIMMYDDDGLDYVEANTVIKSYVKTYTYLRQDDPDFWNKLAYHLPHKAMPATRSGLHRMFRRVGFNDSRTCEREQLAVIRQQQVATGSSSDAVTTNFDVLANGINISLNHQSLTNGHSVAV